MIPSLERLHILILERVFFAKKCSFLNDQFIAGARLWVMQIGQLGRLGLL